MKSHRYFIMQATAPGLNEMGLDFLTLSFPGNLKKPFLDDYFTNLRKEEFELVYSAGLFDYIKTFPLDDGKGTLALTKNLFELVKPGGSLIIGNFSRNNSRDLRFVMEYVYDWQLIHRNKRDIFEFVRAIPEKDIDNMHIVEDPMRINKKFRESEPFPIINRLDSFFSMYNILWPIFH